MFFPTPKTWIRFAVPILLGALCFDLRANESDDSPDDAKTPAANAEGREPGRKTARRVSTIHWQRVPLRDAIGRLRSLFADSVLVDRRIDPNTPVSLDIESESAEEVVAALAAGKDWGVARVGSVVYLGPGPAAESLHAIAAARSQEVGKLPPDVRAPLTKKQPTEWRRLDEPRRLVVYEVEQRGWKVANAELIPQDIWAAGKFPPMTLAEQLTLLLVGFDLSFELRANEREIEIVPLKPISIPTGSATTKPAQPKGKTRRPEQGGRQEYTLRVKELPVGAVLKAVAKQRNWSLQIDEEAIRKAGKSLDTRVSFSVEKVNQEDFLAAILNPAGLDCQIEENEIRVIPARYDDK